MENRLSHSIVTRGAPSFANTETNIGVNGSAASRARRARVIFPVIFPGMIKAAALAAAVFSCAAAGQTMPDTGNGPVTPVLSLPTTAIVVLNRNTPGELRRIFEAKLQAEEKEGEFIEIILSSTPLVVRNLVVNYVTDAITDAEGRPRASSITISEGIGRGPDEGPAVTILPFRIIDNHVVEPLRSTFTFSLLDGEFYTVGSPSSVQFVIIEGVCDRTPQVQDEILAKIAERYGLMVADDDPGGGNPGSNPGGGVPGGGLGGGLGGGAPSDDTLDCSLSHQSVKDPEAELGRILALDLSSQNIAALKQGDFLNLDGLRSLDLSQNRISTLTGGILSDAGALTELQLQENRLSTLTADAFAGLDNLRTLNLHDNQLSTLPASVFSGLGFLSELNLNSNRLSALPPNLLAGLSNLNRLNLSSNRLAALPPNLFAGLSHLQHLDLSGNDGAPFNLTPRWRRTGSASPGSADLRLIIEEGAPTFVAIDLSAEDGTVSQQVVIIDPGTTESKTVRVRQTSNEAVVVRMNVVSLPNSFLGIRTTAGESFVLDEIGPSVSGVEIISTPTSGSAYLSPDNETILVAVAFDEEVEVTTSTAGPALTLGIGDDEPAARYVPERSSTLKLVFGYVLQAGDADDNGVSVGDDALRLNGARITDASQNPASTALGVHAISNAAGHEVIGRKLTLSFEPPTVRIAAGAATQVELVLGNAQVLTGGENVSVVLTPTPGVELLTPSPITIGRTPNKAPVSLRFSAPVSVTTGRVTARALILPSNLRVIGGALSLQRLPVVWFDFDGAPVVEIIEGSTADLTVRFDFAQRSAMVVRYRVNADASDYADPGDGAVTIAAGKTTGVISIGIVDDTEIEAPDESFTVSLSPSDDGPSDDGPGDYALDSTNVALITIREGVCDRTDGVQDGILHAAGVTGCAEITGDELREITSLDYASSGLTTLRGRDFSGLESLTELILSSNRLSTLPPDSFAGLDRLQTLRLDGNDLTGLVADVFESLVNLQTLHLQGNQLDALPPDVFQLLVKLRVLNLSDNRLGELPEEIFSRLTALHTLNLRGNFLTVLPEGIFTDLSGLRSLWLGGAAGDVVLVVDFKRPGELSTLTPPDVLTRLILREGAPFDLDVALQAQGGKLSPDRVMLAAGDVESDPITVTPNLELTTVTMTVPPLPDDVCPETGQRCWRGFSFMAGEPFSSENAVLPGLRLRVRVFLEGALE